MTMTPLSTAPCARCRAPAVLDIENFIGGALFCRSCAPAMKEAIARRLAEVRATTKRS